MEALPSNVTKVQDHVALWCMLSITAWWPAGQTVLILGAGGGVGIAAVQIAKVGGSTLQHNAGYMTYL